MREQLFGKTNASLFREHDISIHMEPEDERIPDGNGGWTVEDDYRMTTCEST